MSQGALRDKADLLRQPAHPTRILILQELAGGAKCVTGIRDLLDIPQPNVSQHLAVLRQSRIVHFYEDGPLRCCAFWKGTTRWCAGTGGRCAGKGAGRRPRRRRARRRAGAEDGDAPTCPHRAARPLEPGPRRDARVLRRPAERLRPAGVRRILAEVRRRQAVGNGARDRRRRLGGASEGLAATMPTARWGIARNRRQPMDPAARPHIDLISKGPS
ncbi:MAG: hypothetical protein Kow0092_27880 [Deferrisomatales bacterium]